MSDLDIAERRKPQDGKIKFKKYAPLDIELRVATIPTVGGEEDVVMRILAAGEPMALDAMGMSERNYNLLIRVITQPYGIALVVGGRFCFGVCGNVLHTLSAHPLAVGCIIRR